MQNDLFANSHQALPPFTKVSDRITRPTTAKTITPLASTAEDDKLIIRVGPSGDLQPARIAHRQETRNGIMAADAKNLAQAVLWDPADAGKVRCRLCNWRCVIDDGKLGRCCVRRNIAAKLYSLNYHKVCSANPDPIEKKPLFHFQPGTRSFSIAAMGCNFQCDFCQNWQVSQMPAENGQIEGQAISPRQIIDAALQGGCKSIAYTYTEPTVFMELCNDCGRIAKEKGLANVFVSNGYMTKEAIDFAAPWLNGINVDLKA
ncbi:MAG: radical SAM protein, partial [Planctomycetes bacterium]|nr:radical SAM protein [Planctomycetota bacterium]